MQKKSIFTMGWLHKKSQWQGKPYKTPTAKSICNKPILNVPILFIALY